MSFGCLSATTKENTQARGFPKLVTATSGQMSRILGDRLANSVRANQTSSCSISIIVV